MMATHCVTSRCCTSSSLPKSSSPASSSATRCDVSSSSIALRAASWHASSVQRKAAETCSKKAKAENCHRRIHSTWGMTRRDIGV